MRRETRDMRQEIGRLRDFFSWLNSCVFNILTRYYNNVTSSRLFSQLTIRNSQLTTHNSQLATRYSLLFLLSINASAQGSFTGSFQADAQRYSEDKTLPYSTLDNRFGVNSYLTLAYQYKNIRVGARAEGYFPPLLGYPQNLDGKGLVNRYINYRFHKNELTLGNFYEQFGSGMALRFQEQRFLGMDTSLDGFLFKRETKGIKTKILAGKQRLGFAHASAWLMGIDQEFSAKKWRLGLSVVNKNEAYDGILTSIKPNVFLWATRLHYQGKQFDFSAEYALKSSDPSVSNKFEARLGAGLYLNANYNINKWSVSATAKRIDNMDFRSQRGEALNNALVNYIPNTTKQHIYRLQTMYPYNSQVLGEVGGQIDVIYSFDDETTLNSNFSILNGLDKAKYYRDFSTEYEKQWSEKWKTNFVASYILFNKEVILGGFPEIVKSLIFVADATYKIDKRKALRFELQHLSTKQDKGNWAMALAELSISPHYFFFASDEINYKNFDSAEIIHYYNAGFALKHKSHRLSLSYGRVREGLLCVGGVCRIVPAYKGLSLSVMSSF